MANYKISAEDLSDWVFSVGKRTAVSKKLGIDESTLFRYETGAQPIPKWLLQFVRMSNRITRLLKEDARLRRELKRAHDKAMDSHTK